MTTCAHCGASLPDGARYCLQCGTAIDPPAPPELLPVSAFIEPAMIGGTALGVLSTLPVISLGNWFCCMWVVGGGALAAWLLGRKHPRSASVMTYGDGAFVGVLSGAFGAVAATVLSIPIRLLSAEALEGELQALEEMLVDLDGPLRDLLLQLLSPDISLLTLLATLFLNLLSFSLFAMVGGILLVALRTRRPIPPPPLGPIDTPL